MLLSKGREHALALSAGCNVSCNYLHTILSKHCLMQVIEAGANALVAGSAVFGASDYKEGVAECIC